MEKEAIRKPIFRRWWFWVIIIAMLLIGIGYAKDYYDNRNRKSEEKIANNQDETRTREGATINNGPSPRAKAFTDEQYQMADAALAAGITVEDPQNDWLKVPEGTKQSDGRYDNSSPYPFGWTDWRSTSFGADQNYLYIKYRFWDVFPKSLPTYGEDVIYGTCGKTDSFTFTNSEGQKDSADLATSIWWTIKNKGIEEALDTPMLDHAARISPTGRDDQGETLHKINSAEGLVGGGPGVDYLVSAYPLKLFGLKIGSEITFDGMSETGSKLFHHEAVDLLQQEPGTKYGITIKWTLGKNKYETVPGVDRSTHE